MGPPREWLWRVLNGWKMDLKILPKAGVLDEQTYQASRQRLIENL